MNHTEKQGLFQNTEFRSRPGDKPWVTIRFSWFQGFNYDEYPLEL